MLGFDPLTQGPIRGTDCGQKAQNYVVPARDPEEGETAEEVEAERVEEQERINTGKPT